VVLEVGLGGRLDAVNIVDADVAVVTSIGLDHQEYLGNTRDSVGYEKAGIARPGRPLVTGERDLPQGFIDETSRIGACVIQRGVDVDWFDSGDGCWGVSGISGGQSRQLLKLPAVRLPRDNLTMAIQALWAAEVTLSDTLIAQALREAYVPGRLERRTVSWRGLPRKLYLDVGHNPHAASYLAEYLRSRPATRQAVFGLLSDKDLSGVVSALNGAFEYWSTAPLPSARSRTAEELAEYLIASGERASSFASVGDALREALDASPASTEIVVFGSFFCVAEAISWLSDQAQELIDG
jgi:dihydrofolate synthase/folylpolyglutamate synthase